MKGKIRFAIKNVHIHFRFDLERNITIITGDSGTGKTKLINMVRQYSELGRSSGVSLSCDKECIVLEGKNWEHTLDVTRDSVVFIEESTQFLKTHEFAKRIQETDNYYVIVSREDLHQIPYSVDSIKLIIKKGKNPRIDNVYKKISVKKISDFPYDVIIVEDSNSGYQFFSKVTEGLNIACVAASGKSNILSELKKYRGKKVLVIADAAALGPEIRELEYYRRMSTDIIDFFLPESFEWLILNSDIFINNKNVKTILEEPIDYIECAEYFSWERFFEYLLKEETKSSKGMKYNKSKLTSGYLEANNKKMIIESME